MDYLQKYRLFLENAALLQKNFSICPLLYGSLGLEIRTSTDLRSDDIDILIPESYLAGEKWLEFKRFLEQSGYCLIDAHEHTFGKDGMAYSYAAIDNLETFAAVRIGEIPLCRESGVTHLLLSLEQYLRVYQASAQDGYRKNVKEKRDGEKIELIEKKQRQEEAIITVRKAGKEDIPRLMEIWLSANLDAHPYIPEQYWKGHYAEVRDYFLPRSELYCAVEKEDGTIIGFIGLVKDYIAGLFVDRKFRGQKAGTKLISHCQARYPVLELDVFAKNVRAIHFYEKMGFSITEQRKSPDTGEEECRMRWERAST